MWRGRLQVRQHIFQLHSVEAKRHRHAHDAHCDHGCCVGRNRFRLGDQPRPPEGFADRGVCCCEGGHGGSVFLAGSPILRTYIEALAAQSPVQLLKTMDHNTIDAADVRNLAQANMHLPATR